MKRQPAKKTGKKLPKIVVVCGPTATGKSDLAVALARQFDGEVVSADSRQVYRGMDIGSGKVTAAEMQGVPHHLLDVADPRKKRYTVDDFTRDASAAIADILSRGKLPIVCGGTGFYIDALVSGVTLPEAKANPKLRAALGKRTAASLMRTLARLDPRRAKSIDPHNKVRVIRAIEIATALGSVPKAKRKRRYNTLSIGLIMPRPELRKRIRARLLRRIDEGMVVEVAKLKASGVSWKRLHDFGLEYRFMALYLQKKLTKDQTLAQLETAIAQYAKRQEAWFKRDRSIHWIAPTDAREASRLAEDFVS